MDDDKRLVLAALRDKFDLEAYVGRTVPLSPGSDPGHSVGDCPLCEAPGALMVVPGKRVWHCFRCHQGGDLFSWVTRTRGVKLDEAIRLLQEEGEG